MIVKEFALYKGEVMLSIGTIEEIAKELNVKAKTIYFYTTDAYKRRLKKRKSINNSRVIVELDED